MRWPVPSTCYQGHLNRQLTLSLQRLKPAGRRSFLDHVATIKTEFLSFVTLPHLDLHYQLQLCCLVYLLVALPLFSLLRV
jgi:hypothetical protein